MKADIRIVCFYPVFLCGLSHLISHFPRSDICPAALTVANKPRDAERVEVAENPDIEGGKTWRKTSANLHLLVKSNSIHRLHGLPAEWPDKRGNC